jgi:NADH-quinone oxidoreductase subunit F
VVETDIVIPAIGQSPDLSSLNGDSPEVNRNSTFKVERDLATSRPGVFAAGDAVLGPATVIEAVAQGNKVAQAVDAYLQKGHPLSKESWLAYDSVEETYNPEDYADAKRPVMPTSDASSRVKSMCEVELGFAESDARLECRRCLRCDVENAQIREAELMKKEARS